MAVTTTSTSVTRSWADIVKGCATPTPLEPELPSSTALGESQPDSVTDVGAQPALKPAMRGERRCRCRGEILVMLGHYGWIMAFEEIDHPDAGKTGGRIYIHKRDVMKGVSLAQGDIVSFYLHADDKGLGAECCQLEQGAPASQCADRDECVPVVDSFCQPVEEPIFLADADGIVPSGAYPPPSWNVCAAEFVPMPFTTFPSCFNIQATEFVPSKLSMMSSDAQEFMPATEYSKFVAPDLNVLAINPAFLSDDESDDEPSMLGNGDFSGNDGDQESNDSDEESSCDESVESIQHYRDIEWSSHLDAVVLHAPLKSPSARSVDDSTSVGSSGSEAEDVMRVGVTAPPGLGFPPGFRPPPGLGPPVLAA